MFADLFQIPYNPCSHANLFPNQGMSKSNLSAVLANRSFLKRVNPSLFAKKSEKTSERAIPSLALFLKERKRDSLFGALFKRAKQRFALWRSFCKERKRKLLFVALFKRPTEKNRSFALFKKPEYLQKRQKVVNFGRFMLSFLFKKSEKRAIRSLKRAKK